MPLYEYACQQCGEQSELLVSGSAQPICPKCSSTRLMKLLSVVAAPKGGTADDTGGKPGGSCGSGCGCHPHR